MLKIIKYLIPFVILVAILFIIFGMNTKRNAVEDLTKDKSILADCIDDATSKVHYHVQIEIVFLGKSYPLPNSVGVDNTCLHPIQIHDGDSGRIHIHSYKQYPYTLGDFFTTWGIIFNQYQLGSVFAGNQYTIKLFVNGKENKEYEQYVLKKDDVIRIAITEKK